MTLDLYQDLSAVLEKGLVGINEWAMNEMKSTSWPLLIAPHSQATSQTAGAALVQEDPGWRSDLGGDHWREVIFFVSLFFVFSKTDSGPYVKASHETSCALTELLPIQFRRNRKAGTLLSHRHRSENKRASLAVITMWTSEWQEQSSLVHRPSASLDSKSCHQISYHSLP